MIEKDANVSIRRQCELLSVPKRNYYYKPKGERDYNKELMALIEEQYLKDSTYGSRRMMVYLRKKEHRVNRKRIMRLMKKMGIKAVYREPRTSLPPKKPMVTDIFVENLTIKRPNQV